MRQICTSDVTPVPWRNGGGLTRELLSWPSPSGWRCRVSVADIASDGPFSAFPGVTRHFVVLEGDGVVLDFAGRQIEQRPGDAPLVFDGAAAPGCRRLGGPVRDLNLMTRRGAWHAAMNAHRLRDGESLSHGSAAAFQLWLCHEGRLRVGCDAQPDAADGDVDADAIELGALDVLRAERAPAPGAIRWLLQAAGPCIAWFIELEPAAPMR